MLNSIGFIICILFNKEMIEERKKKIDDDALSRQLATFGHEAQHKLMAMKVFIYGINGLGI